MHHGRLVTLTPALPLRRCPSSVRQHQTWDLRRQAAAVRRTEAACIWSVAATACRSGRPASADYTVSAALPTIASIPRS